MDRSKNYETFNGGFLNFSKTVESWENETQRNIEQNAENSNNKEEFKDLVILKDTKSILHEPIP